MLVYIHNRQTEQKLHQQEQRQQQREQQLSQKQGDVQRAQNELNQQKQLLENQQKAIEHKAQEIERLQMSNNLQKDNIKFYSDDYQNIPLSDKDAVIYCDIPNSYSRSLYRLYNVSVL